ncbi:MAG: radical SAM protein [Candidatus Sedimenticola sp. 20ELBAFRAG]
MRILLVIYDNASYMTWFPQGPAYIAAVLRQAGHEITIYNQDVHHWPDDHLRKYLDQNHFDVVGIGVIAGYYQYRKLLGLSKAINNSNNRPYYILGGFGPSADPAYFLEVTQADAVVCGEGEQTTTELIDALANGRSLIGIAGTVVRDGDNLITNTERPLIEEIDSLPHPAYDLFPIEYYRLLRFSNCNSSDFVMPVLSGRGCTFKCTFCYRMDKGFRGRSNESILEEIEWLQKNYGITYIAFSDELLMISQERTVSISEAIIKSGLKFKWTCNGRLNYAKPEVLRTMKKAGCVFINYGIEAMDDLVLKKMKKGLKVDQIYPGIEATLAEGISPGFNIIFGNIDDTKETLQKGVDFLLKYDDGAQLRTIRPVTPYPGSPLYYTAIEQGKLKDCRDFYENKHTNSDLLSVNFTEMSDDEFHQSLLEANSQLLDNYFDKQKQKAKETARELYLGKHSDFRGFRQT